MRVSEVLSTENVRELLDALRLRYDYCEKGIWGAMDRGDEEAIAFWRRKRDLAVDLQKTLRRLVHGRIERAMIAEARRNGGNAGL